MLGGVGALVNLLGDGAAESGLLGEPLAGGASDGVPSQLDGARVAVDLDVAGGHDVGFFAKTEFMLDAKGAFEDVVFAGDVQKVSFDRVSALDK